MSSGEEPAPPEPTPGSTSSEEGSADALPFGLDWRRALAIVTGVALALRLVWLLVIPVIPVSDCVAYDVFATNIANGDGFGWKPGEPTAFWPPGTSAFYALLYTVFGRSFWPIAVCNALFGAATAGATMLLVRRWWGARPALLAGALLAVWPAQVQFTTILASELPFTLLVVLALLAWPDGERSRWPRTVGAAVVLGLACYVRGQALLLPIVFALPALVKGPNRLRTAASVGVALAIVVALLLPWSLRNQRTFGKFVLVSANLGTTLWMGTHPDSGGGWIEIPKDEELQGLNSAERDAALKRRAMKNIRARPGGFVVGCVKRLIKTHDRETHGVTWNRDGLTRRFGEGSLGPLKLLSSGYWWGVLLLALGGAGLRVRQVGWRGAFCEPSVLVWGYFAGMHAVVIGGDRYHWPSVPFVAALAGLAGAALLSRWLTMAPKEADS